MRKNGRKRAKLITSSYFSSAPLTKRNGSSRKNRRKKGKPDRTSRYFPKVTKYDFRLRTSQASVTKIRSPSATNEKDIRIYKIQNVTDHPLPKIAPGTNNVENGEGQTFADSLFTETAVNPPVNAAGANSKYFSRSPSSAYGSVLSLGPLVYTWIGSSNYQDIRSNCSRQFFPYGSKRKVCNSCSNILREDAFRHFEACPVFRKELDAYNSSLEYTYTNGNSLPTDRGNDHNRTIIRTIGNKNPPPCVELVGQWAEQHSLRHLCPNQCFLRAFAPSREWMILRKRLEKQTPIGEILKDWTCRLVYETEVSKDDVAANISILPPSFNCIKTENVRQNLKAKQIKSEKLLPVQLPRAVFVSLKSGKVSKNVLDYRFVIRIHTII